MEAFKTYFEAVIIFTLLIVGTVAINVYRGELVIPPPDMVDFLYCLAGVWTLAITTGYGVYLVTDREEYEDAH